MNRNEKLDYLAGFFDAEGCIGIEKQRNRYQLYVTVGQRVPEVLYLYKALFGGNIRQRKQVKEKWHRLWVWRSPCGRNSQFVKLMSGRLKIKAPGLALAEKFIKTLKTTGGRNKINKTAEDIARCMITEEDTAEREKLHQELKAHNKGKNDADDMPVGQLSAAYLAGLFDGDGAAMTAKIRNVRSYVPRATISSSFHALLYAIKEEFGGSVYPNSHPGWRASHWQIANKSAIAFLEHIRKYLNVKKNVVERILALRKLQVNGVMIAVHGMGGGRRFKESSVAGMDSIAAEIKLLNRKGPEYSINAAVLS
jgi:hypothetical protein